MHNQNRKYYNTQTLESIKDSKTQRSTNDVRAQLSPRTRVILFIPREIASVAHSSCPGLRADAILTSCILSALPEWKSRRSASFSLCGWKGASGHLGQLCQPSPCGKCRLPLLTAAEPCVPYHCAFQLHRHTGQIVREQPSVLRDLCPMEAVEK